MRTPDVELETIQHRGDAECDRRMGVVSAGVHPAGIQGHGVVGLRFVDGEGIEVGPEADAGLVSDVDPETGSRGTELMLDPGLGESVGDESRGLVFLVGRLGMTVELATQFDRQGCDLAGQPGDPLGIGHSSRLPIIHRTASRTPSLPVW